MRLGPVDARPFAVGVASLTAAALWLGGCTASSEDEARRPAFSETETLGTAPPAVAAAEPQIPPPAPAAEPQPPPAQGEPATPETPRRRPVSPSPATKSARPKAEPTAAAAAEAVAKAEISTGYRPSGLFQSSYGHGCWDDAIGPGTTFEESSPIPRLTRHNLCLGGFPAGTSFAITLTGPDGSEHTSRTEAGAGVDLVFTNDMPLGEWQVTLTAIGDGTPPAVGTLQVIRPEEPQVYRTAHRAPSGGAGMTFEMAGFPPDAKVNVFLYGPELIRPLPVATTDADGESSYSVTTLGSDPPGDYSVWLNPTCRGRDYACASFEK